MIDPKLQEKLDKLEAHELVGEKVKVIAKLRILQTELQSLNIEKLSERQKWGKTNQKMDAELEVVVYIEKLLKDKDF